MTIYLPGIGAPLAKVSRVQGAVNELRIITDRLERRAARIVLRAFDDLRRRLPERRLASAYNEGGIRAVMELIEPEIDRLAADIQGASSAQGIKLSLQEAYLAGVEASRRMVPKTIGLDIRFDLTNPKAVRFIESYDFGLIREIGTSVRENIRVIVLDGFRDGLAPREQARLIREHIGLTSKQSRAIINFRDQLTERKNAPGGRPMKPAHTRRLDAVDRRIAARQIRQGGLKKKQIDELVERYRQRLINLRATTIARTETIRASTQGQQDLWEQAVEDGVMNGNEIRRKWIVTPDERLCPICREIPKLNPKGVGLKENFKTPIGPLFAPPSPHPNCRCSLGLIPPRA